MPPSIQSTVPVVEASQVGDVRRCVQVALGTSLGFGEQARAEVAIIVTEAATNLVRHASGGEVVFRSLHAGDVAGFEMLSLDRGPGMARLSESLRDGHSTGSTPGTGLGRDRPTVADVRGVHEHQVRHGSALSQLWTEPAATDGRLPAGVVCLPKKGEVACGDAWHVEPMADGRTRVLVADGLGHGVQAADASRLAVRLFKENLHLDPPRMVEALHAGLRSTRGAAVAVVEVPRGAGDVRFTGLGNVAAAILADGASRSLMSHNGTAGVEARRIQEFAYPWRPDNAVGHALGRAGHPVAVGPVPRPAVPPPVRDRRRALPGLPPRAGRRDRPRDGRDQAGRRWRELNMTSAMNLLTIDIRYEQDVVLTRQRARQIAGLLGLSTHEQTAFATAVSELARNAFQYAGHGRTTFAVRTDSGPSSVLVVRVQDKGPGIPHLPTVLAGQYRSRTGMGLGILGAKRLNDEFDIESAAGVGTSVSIGKRLPTLGDRRLAEVSAELVQRTPRNPLEEVQEQNKELLHALDALRARQAEVEQLNRELAETNRGVVALYAELDEKAESLRLASEHKSRFLNDMTHELRTPLNAMISLSRLLLDRVDGDLTAEQEKQVSLVHRSAKGLGEMVNDLLDLAKIEAGKTDLHVGEFDVAGVLAGLRGMFRHMVGDGRVPLVVEEPVDLTTMTSDERKLSQILRNLVSNALKFTEAGEVRVRADAGSDGTAVFTVVDTGIGIAAENLGLIFQDYTQIDSGVQRRVRGTGLGLPLTRKLARLLGGDVSVASEPNAGSTFKLTLPVRCEPPAIAGDGTDSDPQLVGEGSLG